MMESTKTAQVLEQATMTTKIQKDKAYRIKFVRTLCILFSCVTLVGLHCLSKFHQMQNRFIVCIMFYINLTYIV